MCELISAAAMSSAFGTAMPALSVMNVVSLASTVLGAFGSARESEARRDESQYQAAVARNNQIIAEQNALAVEQQGRQAKAQERERARQLRSRQLVALAGQGADVGTGSAVDLLADTAAAAQRDRAIIASDTARQAYNVRAQGTTQAAQAQLLETRAEAESPVMEGVTSFVGNVAPIASKWYSRKPVVNPYAPAFATGPERLY
jgi:hypothetical protein